MWHLNIHSICTYVTFSHLYYETWKHKIYAILKCTPTTFHVISVSSFQVYMMANKVKWFLLSPPQFRRLSLTALASPSDWYHPSYVGALCSAVPNLKWWGCQFLLSHFKGFSKFQIKPLEFGFLCWVPFQYRLVSLQRFFHLTFLAAPTALYLHWWFTHSFTGG